MRFFISLLSGILFFICLIGISFLGILYIYQTKGSHDTPKEIMIPSGTSVEGIAQILKSEHVLNNYADYTIPLMTRLRGNAPFLKAGEYAIPAHASAEEIIALLESGKTIIRKMTFPEGHTVYEITEALKKNPLLSGDITIIPAEGTLMPNTYLYHRGMARDDIITQMTIGQKNLLESLWKTRQEDLPFKSPQEALILASIVEKETGIARERPIIASVFINRLRKGMRLQSDPTIIYGITKGQSLFTRPLYRSDIIRATDHNTYQMDGLPLTPICNAGMESLKAVFNPAQTDYLYFVADGTGGHIFAKTLEEHNANVKKWREIERSKNDNQVNIDNKDYSL